MVVWALVVLYTGETTFRLLRLQLRDKPLWDMCTIACGLIGRKTPGISCTLPAELLGTLVLMEWSESLVVDQIRAPKPRLLALVA
jgi:hypothetical protein